MKKGKPLKCRICHDTFRFASKDSKAKWTSDRMKCPSCGEEYCVLPATERTLRHLQDKYFESGRDNKYIHEIYEILSSYSRSIILKKYSNVVIDPDSLDYHSHCSTVYLVERYFKAPEFEITTSFAGFLMHKIKESLWKKEEHSVGDSSLDTFYTEDVDGKGHYDIPDECSNTAEVDMAENHKYIIENIIEQMQSYRKRYKLSKEESLNLISSQLVLFDSFKGKSLKADGDIDSFFKKFNPDTRKHFLASMDEIRSKL